VIRALCLAAGFAACGCAHHKANQYAYAPPLAPPVYPQPQTAAQPIAYPAGAVPGVIGPPAAAMGPPVTTVAGELPALPDGSCPPCNSPSVGTAVPVVYDGAMQTTPCPPGP